MLDCERVKVRNAGNELGTLVAHSNPLNHEVYGQEKAGQYWAYVQIIRHA